MTREWDTGDPEPADHPPVVDCHNVTWLYDSNGDGHKAWNRQRITRHPGGGGRVGPIGQEWAEVLEEYGPVREATAAESYNVTVVIA